MRKLILVLLVTFAFAGPVAAGSANPFHLVTHTESTAFGTLDYCYDQDNFDYFIYQGDLLAGESFSASLRFCDLAAGDAVDDGNTQFYLKLSGRGQYTVDFTGSDVPVPIATDVGGTGGRETWLSCNPAPGAVIQFTVTTTQKADTFLSFGSTDESDLTLCP